jgi:hypothetical protein
MFRSRQVIGLLIGLFIGISIGFQGLQAWGSTPTAVPTITGTDLLTKKTIQFPDSKKAASVVVFLSSQCPCSASHEPVIQALATEFKDKNVEFLVVNSNTNETEKEVVDHFTESKKNKVLQLPILRDAKAKIANQFKALKTPHAFVISKNEIVFAGGIDDSAEAADAKKHFLREALIEITSGKAVTTKVARALGCAIKR